ncbi:gamma carbonic anhydrase family protein [Nocardioides sp.]|uniref:gamma carbonic anhydrase family protein n=1 Tax=Nocardioides sp. TaxID=35761 RepID=UPI0039E6FB0B
MAASSLIADNVYIIGDVEIGENCSIWPGVVIRGDTSSVRIGDNCHIEENSVLHTGTVLGDHVMIGHCCLVEGPVGERSMIANGATILARSKVGKHCTIGASSLVLGGVEIPDYSLAIGTPAKVVGTIDPDAPEDRHGSVYYTSYMEDMVAEYKREGIWARG